MKSPLKYINSLYKSIVFILLLFVVIDASSQSLEINTRIGNDTVMIGMSTDCEISVKLPANLIGKEIIWPEFKDTLSKEIDIEKVYEIDTVLSENNDGIELILKMDIIPFESGLYVVPQSRYITVMDSELDTNTHKIITPTLLYVAGIEIPDCLIVMEQDSAMFKQKLNEAIKDIAQPEAVPLSLTEILIYVGFFLLILVVVFGIINLILNIKRKKNTVEVKEVKKEIIPAHIIAKAQLDELSNKKLWQSGEHKSYHIELSEIIRVYIKNRFSYNALELTTDEIISCFNHVSLDTEALSLLKQMLVLSDMVKFAKYTPVATENETSLADAYRFVELTKLNEVTINKEESSKDV